MAEQTATLTHKVRNPQNLDSWLNIWEANVSANYDDNNNRNDESIVIKPSENWQIPFDNIQWPSTESTTNLLRSDGQWADTSHLINWTQELSTRQNSVIYSFIEQDTKKRTISQYRAGLKGLGKIKFQYDPNDFPSALSRTETDADGEVYGYSEFFLPSVNISLDPLGTEDIADEAITSEKIASITTNKISDLSTYLTNNINSYVPNNSKTEAGVVTAGNDHNSEVWSTDSEGNPIWGKITADHMTTDLDLNNKLQDASISGNKLDTKLLGVWIGKDSISKDWIIENSENNNYWSYQDSVTYIIGSDNHEYTFDWNINISLLNDKIIYNYNMPYWSDLSTEINLDENKNSYENILSAYDLGILLKNFIDTQVQNSHNQPYSAFTMKSTYFKDAANNILIRNFDSNVNSEKIYPINFYRLSDWDYEHCGIWIEI